MKLLDWIVTAAHRKGWIAFYAGKKESDCPYAEKGLLLPRIPFRRAWLEGWQAAMKSDREILKYLKEEV